MSAPDTNALSPAPVITATRTAGSPSQPSRMVARPSHMATDMALRRSGWLKVSSPTPSDTDASSFPDAYSISYLFLSLRTLREG